MIPFHDLTDEEMSALTADEITRYKNLEAAEGGIAIPGPQPEVFEEENTPKDEVAFEVAGLYFRKREDAEKVREFLNNLQPQMCKLSYDYSVGYDDQYREAWTDAFTVAEKPCFSLDKFNAERARMSTYKQRKEAADKDMRDWKKSMDEFKKCCDWVNDRVTAARERVNARVDNQRRFDEYLSLADGDTERAWAFFTKAKLEIEGFRPVGAPGVEAV